MSTRRGGFISSYVDPAYSARWRLTEQTQGIGDDAWNYNYGLINSFANSDTIATTNKFMPQACVIDPNDDALYVTSYNSNVTTYGGNITKTDLSGNVYWSKEIECFYLQDMAVDSSSNIYVVGYIFVTSIYKIFIAKLDSTGTILWQRIVANGTSSSYSALGKRIGVDSSGNVYVIGNQVLNSYSFYSSAIFKYNSSGTLQWQKSFDSVNTSGDVFVLAMSVDSSTGDIYYAGYGVSTVSASRTDAYYGKMNTSGTIVWSKYIPPITGTSFIINAISYLASGSNIYLAGTHNNAAYVGIGSSLDGSISSYHKSYTNGTNTSNLAIAVEEPVDYSGDVDVYTCGSSVLSGTTRYGSIFKNTTFLGTGSVSWQRKITTNAWPSGGTGNPTVICSAIFVKKQYLYVVGYRNGATIGNRTEMFGIIIPKDGSRSTSTIAIPSVTRNSITVGGHNMYFSTNDASETSLSPSPGNAATYYSSVTSAHSSSTGTQAIQNSLNSYSNLLLKVP